MDGQSGGRAGHKKGAHYSAPMPAGPLPRISGRDRPVKGRFHPRFQAFLAALLGLATAWAAVGTNRTESDAQKAESELQSVKSEIDRITRQVSEEQVERDRLTHELRSAEVS